jgi:uncharacterized repeat protein (TIGR02543 family)
MRKFQYLGGFILLLSIISTNYFLPVLASSIDSSSLPTSSGSETSSTESSETPSSSEDNTVVLAVNESLGFQSATNFSTNYRSVGSTFFNNSNKYVYLSNGAGYSAGSFFTKNKIFLSNSESSGFSTFFEMSLFGASGYADGFTFIVSRNINVLGNAGGAIGYGGITNSIAVLFDNYNNGGQPPLCLSLGVNGGQGDCQYSGYYSGNFKIWIDYSRNTSGGRLEVRMHNQNNFNRPANPTRAWNNLSFDAIGNEFFTGFTAATGGESQYAFLKSWYFSASYSPNGIDPKESANFVTDNIPPENPKVEPYLIGDQWFFKPDPRHVSEPNLTYLYTLGDNPQSTFYNPITARASFNTANQLLSLFALDLAGNRSPGPGTYQYYKANFILNYTGASTVVNFYPAYSEDYPVTDNINLFIPVRPGFRFEGWATNPVQTTNLVTTHRFLGNANFFARWSFLPYTVTFNTNGGNTINEVETDIDRGFTLPNQPVKANHTFAGWFLDETFNTPLILGQFPHTTLTLFAKWTINTHVITLQNSVDNQSTSLTYDYGTNVTLSSLAPAPREGFVFAGFYSDPALTNLVPGPLVVNGNQTLYERWIDLRPVTALHNAIQQIPSPLTTTQANQDALVAARQAYEALSTEQEGYVDEAMLVLLAALEKNMVDLLAVEAVVLQVDSLPRIMSLDANDLLQDATEAYANLTADQKALFPTDRQHHLNDLKTQYSDLSQANEVETLAWEIPNQLTIADISMIEAAIEAFDLLLPSEVALMDPETVAKLRAARGQLDLLLACQGLIDLIQAIGPDVTMDDDVRIQEAFTYFENMSAEEVQYLDMQYYQFLLTYSKIHQDMTLAEPVSDILSALPTTIQLTNEAQVLDALAAYDALSNDQQQFIDEDLVEQLRAALQEIERLKNLGGGGGPINPPVDPPIDPPLDSAYFPWIIIIVLVTWLGAYALVTKKPNLIP